MDLSFTRFTPDPQVTVLPPDLAVLLVGIAARQAASPTAMIHARIAFAPPTGAWFAPAHGCFNQLVAATLTRWQEE